MKYRRFGRTELSLPVFSCGGMRYQFKWQDVPLRDIPVECQDNVEATIQRALALGINHIETARGYGSSEMQLGRILPSLPREKIIVQTKVAPMSSAKEFLKTFDRSMDYLGLDYVDLLALHGINHRELLRWSLQKNGCVAAARQLQKDGRIPGHLHVQFVMGVKNAMPADEHVLDILLGELRRLIPQATWTAAGVGVSKGSPGVVAIETFAITGIAPAPVADVALIFIFPILMVKDPVDPGRTMTTPVKV